MGTRNSGKVIGRIGAQRDFTNSDGSKQVLLTVMADRDYRNRQTGERDSDAVQVEAWVRAETQGLGIWAHTGVGDLVAVDYSVRSSRYVDKHTGELIYAQALSVDNVALLESRTVTQARRITRLQAQLGTTGAGGASASDEHPAPGGSTEHDAPPF